MYCLDKLQRELASFFDIDLRELPKVQEILQAQGYKAVQKGEELIFFDNKPANTQSNLNDLTFTDSKGKKHTITPEIQEQWLKTFNLKSIDEDFIPTFSPEVKAVLEAQGIGEIHLKSGSLVKLLERERLEFIDKIKPTLENADAIVRQSDGAMIFVKDFNEKKYFTSVAKGENGEWIVTSNAPKTLNNIQNKIQEGGELLFSKLPELPIIAKPELPAKALNSEATSTDIIPQKNTKPQSNAHLGSGLVSGSVAGFESDESGNLHFNPAHFLLGLGTGAVGSKAITQGFKAISKNPEFKAKITQELADTLAKGWDSATQKYPILSALEPRYIIQNERGRNLQAQAILKEVEQREQPKLRTIQAVDTYAQSAEFKALSPDKQQAILDLAEIIPEPMPKNATFENLGNLLKHFNTKTDRTERTYYTKLLEDTKQKPHIVLNTLGAKGEMRKEYIKAYQHEQTHDLYYIAITQDKDKINITAFPTTQTRKIIRDIARSKSVVSSGNQLITPSQQKAQSPELAKDDYNTKLQSNTHLGSGIVSGSVAGFESDESGNLSFNPAHFLLGLGTGAVGSKAITQGFKAISKNPEFKAKVTKELANTLAKGWDSATKQYPILSALEPRYIIQNERGRSLQAQHILRELEQKEAKGLYNVAYNGKNATRVLKDLENVEEVIRFSQGNKNKGAKHIRFKHNTDESQQGYITPPEITNLGKDLRAFLKDYEPFTDKNGANVYEWENKEGVRFRLVVNEVKREADSNPAQLPKPFNEEIITFYSDRNLKERMQFKNPILNQEKFKLEELEAPTKQVHSQAIGEQLSKSRKLEPMHPNTPLENSESIIPQTKLHSNAHLGSGLVSGSVAGFESDESGNLSFNPAHFLLGLGTGAVGSKAITQGFKAISKNPEFKAKVTKELANTLAKGWDSATKQYPILSALEPRYIIQNERGRSLQAQHILREMEKEAGKLEKAFLLEDKINTEALEKEAVELPKPIEKLDFIKQAQKDKKGYFVKTPIGRVDFKNIIKTYRHLYENTYMQDRRELSGAFMETLKNPLFVVRQKYQPNPQPLTQARHSHLKPNPSSQAKNTKSLNGDVKTDKIIQDSYVFYKPFKDDKGLVHLASFAIAQNGELLHKTFYDIKNLSKLQRILKSKDENVIYFKGEQ